VDEKHIASLQLAVGAVIGPIAKRISYETIADVDADADVIAVEV